MAPEPGRCRCGSVPAASISPTCWPARGSTTACRRRPSAPGWSAPGPSAPWGMESTIARWEGARLRSFPSLFSLSLKPQRLRLCARPREGIRSCGIGGGAAVGWGGWRGGLPLPPVFIHHLLSPIISSAVSHHLPSSAIIISHLPSSSPISHHLPVPQLRFAPWVPTRSIPTITEGLRFGFLPGSGCSQRINPAPKPCPRIWGGESIAAGLPSWGLEAPGRRSRAEGAELCTNNVFLTLSSTKG